MRRSGISRRQLFESVERAALASLPGEDYEFAEWRLVRVSTDYHIEFKTFFYSVPHSLIRQQVDLRATAPPRQEHCLPHRQPQGRAPFHRTDRHH